MYLSRSSATLKQLLPNVELLKCFSGTQALNGSTTGKRVKYEVLHGLQDHSTIANVDNRSGNGFVWSMSDEKTPLGGMCTP